MIIQGLLNFINHYRLIKFLETQYLQRLYSKISNI